MSHRKPPGITWESFVEHQIQEAQRAGKFDNLPGFGQPLPELDEPYDENRWVKHKAREEHLSLLPPALEIRQDIARTLAAALDLPTEAAVRETIEALNERIRRATFAITWGPASSTMPLDVEEVVSDWRDHRSP
jgi:hypothetical protein